MLVDADAATSVGMMAFKASEFEMLVRPFDPSLLRPLGRIAVGDNFDKWASFLPPSVRPSVRQSRRARFMAQVVKRRDIRKECRHFRPPPRCCPSACPLRPPGDRDRERRSSDPVRREGGGSTASFCLPFLQGRSLPPSASLLASPYLFAPGSAPAATAAALLLRSRVSVGRNSEKAGGRRCRRRRGPNGRGGSDGGATAVAETFRLLHGHRVG